MNTIFRTIILILFSSFIFPESIKFDKNLFIDFDNKDKYLNVRKGILKKKKHKLNAHNIKSFDHNLRLSINKTYHRSSFTRDSYILLNVECIDGPNTGFELVLTADSNQGEVVIPGWDQNDYVCVIAQNCTVMGCSDSVGPVCVYPGANDGIQNCVDDSFECDNQLLGDSNNDGSINVIDIVTVVNYILDGDLNFDDCNVLASDFNQDQQLDVLDIVEIINLILSDNPAQYYKNSRF